ncbi:hypothetical protein EOM81_01705 [bacterium]|nr:hypothetical protein [bacterium]
MAKEKAPYVPSEIAQRVLDILKDSTEPMSLADISAHAGVSVKPGHVSTLKKQGLINSVDAESVCPTCGAKRSFKLYSLVR